jgi:hypothetical protein
VHTVCEQQSASRNPATIGRLQLERPIGEAVGSERSHVAEPDRGVRLQLRAAQTPELARRGAIVGEEPVHRVGHGVGRRVGIQDEDSPPHAAKHESRIETGGAGADHENIECVTIGGVHIALLGHTV